MEEAYGVYNLTTKKWNGVVEKLMNNETDIGIGEFSITDKRLDVIDFSEPIVIAQASYYVKKPEMGILPWSMYYKVLYLNIFTILSF